MKKFIAWPFTIIRDQSLEQRIWYRALRMLHAILYVISLLLGYFVSTALESRCDQVFAAPLNFSDIPHSICDSVNWYAVIGLGLLSFLISLVLSKVIIQALVYIITGKQNHNATQ